MRPTLDLAGCAAAHARLLVTVDEIDDDVVRRPSRLPGWTVAHVLTHLARNADSHVRRFDGARRGEVVDQYPGGFEGREAEIEAGAARDAAAIVADLRSSIAVFDDACAAMPDDAWNVVSRDVGGTERRAADLPLRRWQEVEVHHVDLGLGYAHTDWPDDFVARRLPGMLAKLPERLPPGVAVPTFEGVPQRDVLAWLYGRMEIPGLPVLPDF